LPAARRILKSYKTQDRELTKNPISVFNQLSSYFHLSVRKSVRTTRATASALLHVPAMKRLFEGKVGVDYGQMSFVDNPENMPDDMATRTHFQSST
jgi:hypothetical protein